MISTTVATMVVPTRLKITMRVTIAADVVASVVVAGVKGAGVVHGKGPVTVAR